MQISDDQLAQFTGSWEVTFNERLSQDEAKAKAAELLDLFNQLARRPPTKEE